MNRYGQFCAVARALDTLGERWTLLVVRELLGGPASFTDICRGLPRIPRATLSSRLRGLRSAEIVSVADGKYVLTPSGQAIAPVMRELAKWATVSGSAALSDDDIDTAALTWDMQRRVNFATLPPQAVVLAIEFTDRAVDRNFWLHLSPTSVDLCREDTGAPVDIWLTAPVEATTRWWLGELSWSRLLRHPDVKVHGDRTLRRQMDRWFLGYAFSPEALGVRP